MPAAPIAPASTPRRRESRETVEMFAHFRHGAHRCTVMLQDLTRHGARIEGHGALQRDEAIGLALPGLAPVLAFVAWCNGPCAGIEFAEPLRPQQYESLLRDHALPALRRDPPGSGLPLVA